MSDKKEEISLAFVLVWFFGLALPPLSLVIPAIYYGWKGLNKAAPPTYRMALRATGAAATVVKKRADRKRMERENQRIRNLPPPPPPETPVQRREKLFKIALVRFDQERQLIEANPHLDADEKEAAIELGRQTMMRNLQFFIES